MLPLILGAGVAVTVAAILVRVFTTGAGIELHQPGAQLLFDALAVVAATICVLARALERERPFQAAGWTLPAGVLVAIVLVTAAARAPNADLGWRTASTWTALLLLGLTVRDLGRDLRLARGLTGVLLASLATVAALGIYEYVVEYPQLLAAYQRGEFDESLELQSRGLQIAMNERIQSRAAVGPFLLPGLLATAMIMGLPLLGVVLAATIRGDRRSPGLAVASALGACALGLALILTKSKGGVVTVAGTSCLFAALHPKAARFRTKLVLGGLGIGALLGGVGLALYASNPERYGVALSLQVRLEYWQAGLGMWRDAPLLGHGLNAFRDLYSFYKPLRAEETLHAHNAAVQLLAETGLVGLVAFGGLLAAWAREALTPGGEPQRPPGADSISERVLALGAGFGVFLGVVLLAGYGDRYSVASDSLAPLALIAGLVPLAGAVFARGLARVDSPALLASAALAGGAALVWDGLLNFGLHHAGVLCVGSVLLGLAPALGQAPPVPRAPVPVRVAAALAVGLLAAWLLLGAVPDALTADVERDRARYEHAEAARLLADGKTRPGIERLTAALEAYDAAVAAYPGDVRTWIERAGALDGLARAAPQQRAELHTEALRSVRRAAAIDPWAADVQDELGRLLSHSDLPAANAAFDAAVRLYPSHPGFLLHAARARAQLRAEVQDAPERKRLAEEARELAERALQVSEQTRLVRLKLSDAERSEVRALLDSLATR